MLKRQIRELVRGQHVVSARPTDSVRFAAQEMKRAHVAAVLVTSESHDLVGIITERDIVDRVVAVGLDPAETRIDMVMTPDPLTIRGDATVRDSLHKMYENEVRHMPVTDENRVIGVVSIRDFISDEISEYDHDRAMAHRLWETLG